jgi:hypothetical protein
MFIPDGANNLKEPVVRWGERMKRNMHAVDLAKEAAGASGSDFLTT